MIGRGALRLNVSRFRVLCDTSSERVVPSDKCTVASSVSIYRPRGITHIATTFSPKHAAATIAV